MVALAPRRVRVVAGLADRDLERQQLSGERRGLRQRPGDLEAPALQEHSRRGHQVALRYAPTARAARRPVAARDRHRVQRARQALGAQQVDDRAPDARAVDDERHGGGRLDASARTRPATPATIPW